MFAAEPTINMAANKIIAAPREFQSFVLATIVADKIAPTITIK
jgi:hypothetical protein